MKSIISGAMQDVIRVMNAATNAFVLFGETAARVAAQVAEAGASISNTMADVGSNIQGSPTLKIQHPFEDFLAFMKQAGPELSSLMASAFEPAVAASLAVVQSPSSLTTTTIDQSINTGDLSGVPFTSPDDTAQYLIAARKRARNGGS